MVIRVVAAGAYVWLGFVVYNVAVDAFHYWTEGLISGERVLRHRLGGVSPALVEHQPSLQHLWNHHVSHRKRDANVVCHLCFAGLWGAYFFYRAFCIAFPEGNRGLYGLLVVLLPSIVYWSSAIGKDALAATFHRYSSLRLCKSRQGNECDSSIMICAIGIAGATAVQTPCWCDAGCWHADSLHLWQDQRRMGDCVS